MHSKVDVYASIAVFVGLLVSGYWAYADPALALLIGIWIIRQSFKIGKEATDSLLDVSAGREVEGRIRGIIKSEKIEVSELKTQRKGPVITANIKISCRKKHERADGS